MPPIIRCSKCEGTLIYKVTDEGYTVYHNCNAAPEATALEAIARTHNTSIEFNEAECNDVVAANLQESFGDENAAELCLDQSKK